ESGQGQFGGGHRRAGRQARLHGPGDASRQAKGRGAPGGGGAARLPRRLPPARAGSPGSALRGGAGPAGLGPPPRARSPPLHRLPPRGVRPTPPPRAPAPPRPPPRRPPPPPP